jgi:hypothetical protein
MSVAVDSNNYRPVTRDEFRTQDPLSMFFAANGDTLHCSEVRFGHSCIHRCRLHSIPDE